LLKTAERLKDLQETIDMLKEKSGYELLAGQEKELLSLLADYSKTLTLLEEYDKEKLVLAKQGKGRFVLSYEKAMEAIDSVKNELINKKEASELFGRENGDKFKSIIGNLYQTYGGKELYPSLEEKAAHLLYFTIKDHPFVDGNKRSAALTI
jgi:sulfur relay (sulfurtransferase) DsrF/TusC family protein